MTSLDILSGHLELSVDEIKYLLDQWNDVAYRLECNMDQLYEDYMDVELGYGQIKLVTDEYKMIQPQTALSLLIDRLGGAPLSTMRFILDNCAAVGYQFGSIQRWYEDWMDSALDETDTTEQEIRDALVHRV